MHLLTLGALEPQVGNTAVRKLAQALICSKYYMVAICCFYQRFVSLNNSP